MYNYYMIIGHGIDIVDLKRFRIMNQERLAKLAKRICTESELNDFTTHKTPYQYLAKVWATKEAIAKAFGTGIRGNVVWANIQLKSDKLGKPIVSFNKDLAGPLCHVSISHENDYLVASAILEEL